VLAIRNPRGHEYAVKDDPDTCLDHLSLVSLLLRRVEKLKEIIALGYVPVEIAVELKLLQPHWSPPEISSPTEREWMEKIKRNEM
jgi:hypothetical protein